MKRPTSSFALGLASLRRAASLLPEPGRRFTCGDTFNLTKTCFNLHLMSYFTIEKNKHGNLTSSEMPQKAPGAATPIPVNREHPPHPTADCLCFELRDGDAECYMARGLLSLSHSFLILGTVICSKVAGLGSLVVVIGWVAEALRSCWWRSPRLRCVQGDTKEVANAGGLTKIFFNFAKQKISVP